MAASPQISPMTQFQALNSQPTVGPRPVQYGPVHTAVAPPDTLESPTTATSRESAARTRHSSACFPCAKRKVKCDRDVKNPCSNCLKRGQPEGCQVKTQKERLSQSLSEQLPRNGEVVHRDKRPRYEPYQVAFQTAPSTAGSSSPQLLPSHVSSVASRAPTLPDEQPSLKHSISSASSRKSKESLQWDAVEPLLPPRKDLLKYIGTYRIGPHIVNPVISNLDAFESHVCTLLEEVGTPKIKQRLASKDRRASEIELGRLARLLAVLASGARYEDSDYNSQVTVSRDYVRKAFQCLRLANYMLRPTIECIQTLLLLSVELQNDHQVGAAWALLGTTAGLAHGIGVSSRIAKMVRHDQDAVMASRCIIWQDIMLALAYNDPDAGPSISADMVELKFYEPGSTGYLPLMFRFYTIATHLLRRESSKDMPNRFDTIQRLHELRNLQGNISSDDCKSMKDRHEYAGLKIFTSYVLAQALPHFNDTKGYSNLGHAALDPKHEPSALAQQAYMDVIQTFVEFSAISNMPLRTWMMVHFTLDAALDLCDEQGVSVDESFLSTMSKLVQLLGGGSSTDAPLSAGHAEAVQALEQYCAYIGQKREEEHDEFPHQLRSMLHEAQNRLASTDAPAMESQTLWGL